MSAENEMSVFDQAFDRGYKQGYRHGAADEKNADAWHVPEITPKHEEMVQVLVRPYSWKSARWCRKRKINWIQINGIFLSGEELAKDMAGPDDDLVENEVPDVVLISKHDAVDWSLVLLWTSAEVPEWFREKYKGEGDS